MPIADTMPTIGQLQEFRATGKFNPESQKVDIHKSAKQIAAVKLGGKLIGFGTVEYPTAQEIARTHEISKSALPASMDDPNNVFDDSPLLPDYRNEKLHTVELQKSALTDDQETLEGIFPRWLQNN